MNVYGYELIVSMLEEGGYLFKLVANDQGVVLFPHTTEHSDAAQFGIRYAHDSQGNALAAMVKPGRIEFRHHRAFSDQRVRDLSEHLLKLPEMQFAADATVTYQGRVVIQGTG